MSSDGELIGYRSRQNVADKYPTGSAGQCGEW